MRTQIRTSLFSVILMTMSFSMAGAIHMPMDGSVQAYVSDDPIWCPLGVTPSSGVGGCSPSFSTLTGLLSWLRKNDPDQEGTIWIEKTYDSAAEGVSGFILDGSGYAHLRHHSLTIQGGWNGPGTSSVDVSDPSMFNGDFLHISNWQASITVNDISINGARDTGLSVYTSGDINLSNITSNNSHATPSWAFGLDLNNIDGDGSVTVSLSGTNVFNGNDIGLRILTNSDVGLNNLTVNGNGVLGHTHLYGGYGASVDIAGDTGSVALTGANIFNNNQGSGLRVFAPGAITAQSLTANDNESKGVELRNETGSLDINLNGPNVFSHNGQTGLTAFSNGRIRLAYITMDGNGHDSTWLDRDGVFLNTSADAVIECAKIYRNQRYGLNATRVIGALTLNDVTFTDNVSGPYSYGGTADIQSGGCASLTLRTFELIHDSRIELNCTEFNGTEVILPQRGRAILHCPTEGDIYIQFEKLDPLPDPLPDKDSFVSAMNLFFKDEEINKQITPGLAAISFILPKDVNGEDFSILYWDGKQWADLDGAIFDDGRKVIKSPFKTNDGYLETQVNFIGTFVLVKK